MYANPAKTPAEGRIIGTVHDELILEVPDQTVENSATILRETMTKAGKAYLSRVPIEVEVTVAGRLRRVVADSFSSSLVKVLCTIIPEYYSVIPTAIANRA